MGLQKTFGCAKKALRRSEHKLSSHELYREWTAWIVRVTTVRSGETISFGPFRLLVVERLLLKDGINVAVGGRALDILIALAARAGEIVSERELTHVAWPGLAVSSTSLRTQISTLRKALGERREGSRYIVNVPGRGYILVAPVKRTAASGADTAVTRTTRSRNLPPPPKLLVGRKEAIADLSSLLLSRRFISVVGPGGIGKTTVAVATAHALRQQFGEDGLCFVDLGSLSDPRDVPNALASVLDRAFQGVDPETYMCAFLADKRILIVLDGCEHVIGATATLCERLLPNAPSLHLLTTSREALRVEGESVHLLPPLDSPREETPSAAQALASPAVQLFMERASSGGYKGELTDAEAPVVASICRRLDGIALAIELVASRVGAYGIQGTADLLESGAELLLQGRRSSSPRHRTLQAMLDWSFKLLSADEQMVLRRLSVFVGQFTLPGAYAVAAATDGERYTVPDAFARLVDKSLI
ncbi:NB-ARC domain-containing protein [Rhizobium sp. BK251]|nr:NB-ARC domain-containing protein [Rhizobium sp. BK251]